MTKILFGILVLLILTIVIIAVCCTCVIADRSNDDNGDNNGEDDEMFWKKQICPKCKVGKESYELDRYSETCTYIGCWKDGKCQFYIPIEKSSKTDIFKK